MKADMHEKIYEMLSEILGIKFKTQLRGTEIYFIGLYKMKNLINNEDKYLLILEDKKSILFTAKTNFLEQFVFILENYIKALDEEFAELQFQQQNNSRIDENEMFSNHERIGYCGERLQKLLNKLQEFQKTTDK